MKLHEQGVQKKIKDKSLPILSKHISTKISFNKISTCDLRKQNSLAGEVPIRSKTKPLSSDDSSDVFTTPPLTRSSSHNDKHESSSSCFGKRLGSLKRNQKLDNAEGKMATYPKAVKGLESKSNRSLPRTLKIQETTRFVYYSLSALYILLILYNIQGMRGIHPLQHPLLF